MHHRTYSFTFSSSCKKSHPEPSHHCNKGFTWNDKSQCVLLQSFLEFSKLILLFLHRVARASPTILPSTTATRDSAGTTNRSMLSYYLFISIPFLTRRSFFSSCKSDHPVVHHCDKGKHWDDGSQYVIFSHWFGANILNRDQSKAPASLMAMALPHPFIITRLLRMHSRGLTHVRYSELCRTLLLSSPLSDIFSSRSIRSCVLSDTCLLSPKASTSRRLALGTFLWTLYGFYN